MDLSPTQINGDLSYCFQDSANRNSSNISCGKRYLLSCRRSCYVIMHENLKRKQKEGSTGHHFRKKEESHWEDKRLVVREIGEYRRNEESRQYYVMTAKDGRIFIRRGETPTNELCRSRRMKAKIGVVHITRQYWEVIGDLHVTACQVQEKQFRLSWMTHTLLPHKQPCSTSRWH